MRAGGGGGGGGGRGDSGNPTGMAALTRWTGGRFPRAFDFIQAQRRRLHAHQSDGRAAQGFRHVRPRHERVRRRAARADRHPCAVVPYKFDSPQAGARRRRRRRGAARRGQPRRPHRRTAQPVVYNQQPICAVIAGNLYNDDKILSVAHQYQIHTNWHLKHPTI